MEILAAAELLIPRLGEAKLNTEQTLGHKVESIQDDDKILFHRHIADLHRYIKDPAALPLLELAGPRQKLFFN
ncbi:MAG: hypothetical protein LBL50_04375, partial [Candidatus Margulisbacteria bacterium]|nr:hypothetical protein [Candidatus Margulisiibacteriota bacterium]